MSTSLEQDAIKIYIGPKDAEHSNENGWHTPSLGSNGYVRSLLLNAKDRPVVVHGEDAQLCVAQAACSALIFRASPVQVPLSEIWTRGENEVDDPLALRARRLAFGIGSYELDNPNLQVEPLEIWEAAKAEIKAQRGSY